MFTRINRLKDLGVFKDYQRRGDIPDFKQLNLFYGWNYSGKTTLSRVFQFFERNIIDPYYDETSFELLDDDAQRYNRDNLNIRGIDIRVFNSDFVKKNLKWDGESFSPILLLGEDSIDAQKRITTLLEKVEQCEELIVKCDDISEKTDDKIKQSLTGKAAQIRSTLQLVEAFNRSHLNNSYIRVIRDNHSEHKIVPEDLNNKIRSATASEDDKLDSIDDQVLDLQLSDIISQSSEVLKEKPEFSSTIKYFIDNPNVASWVESGITIHEDKENCEFCGSPLSDERRNELISHFSEDLKNHKKALSDLSEELIGIKLSNLTIVKRDFYKEFQGEFSTCLSSLKKEIRFYNKQIDALNEVLKEKASKPFEPIEDISFIEDNTTKIETEIDNLNVIISKNNSKTNQFDEIKSAAIEELKGHYAAECIDEIDLFKLEEKISIYENRSENLKSHKGRLNEEIAITQASISKAQKGREQMNSYIEKFLGRDEIKIDVVDEEDEEKFILLRNEDLAINLSEGEKTAIAFSFYLTKLSELEDFEKAILYIDDPISSLDNNHIFQINALIKEFCFENISTDANNEQFVPKFHQLFFSTHNFEFFNLLRELPFKGSNKRSMYFIKRISDSESTIEELPKSYENYISEYQYLFSRLHQFHESDNKQDYETLMGIPNAVRRFVELYTYSRIPGHRINSTVDKRASKLWGTDKSKRILKVFHYFSHSNNIERIMRNSDLLCDVENAVSDLMTLLEEDRLHFEELKRSIN
ncbi:AAA family ATPase [Muricauda sp. 2012CJ35-5]|uniref:AAA family ATPase n=1 Tax=Flagellimonas spongiicola TaxID=2942208 RepID=A0ABT0PRM2_9FLAO|nr:AAA family ATPase [Allomuricauda spongiicola]MCL6273382.1 AAA family ATPase [Allomuricauda spongiicola]